MPATAARCGRASASRRAAISASAGVRTLTTTAWARAAPDDHRSGRAVVRRWSIPPDSGPSASAAGPLPSRRAARGYRLDQRRNATYHAYGAVYEQTAQPDDVTVRVAKDDGRPPDPATFAAAASKAASSRNASVVSAHTAEEIICVAGWSPITPAPSSKPANADSPTP